MRKIYSSPPKHVLLNMFMRFFIRFGSLFSFSSINESLKELEEPIENVNLYPDQFACTKLVCTACGMCASCSRSYLKGCKMVFSITYIV